MATAAALRRFHVGHPQADPKIATTHAANSARLFVCVWLISKEQTIEIRKDIAGTGYATVACRLRRARRLPAGLTMTGSTHGTIAKSKRNRGVGMKKERDGAVLYRRR